MGFTDDRRYIWAGGLAGSEIYVFDIATDPAQARSSCTRSPTSRQGTGYIGPHTYYALPGRMLVQALSNDKDKGGVTGMALYNNKGEFIARYPDADHGRRRRLRLRPRGQSAKKNVLLTSSFTGYDNYMRPIGELIKDEEAMKRFGNTMVLWDLKAMKPEKVFSVPGAPLEIRWSLNPEGDNWAITAAALTSKIWLVKQDAEGEWQAKEVADDRRSVEDPAAGGHQHHARRQRAVGQHVHGRHDALLRSLQSRKRRSRPTRRRPASRST